MQNQLRAAFLRWKNTAQSMAVRDALSAEKKKTLLETMNRFSLGNGHSLLREVLRRFFVNGQANRAVRALNLMLLKTVGGKVHESFSRWRTIPDRSNLGKLPLVSRFYVSLAKAKNRLLKHYLFDPLSDLHDEA